MEESERVVVCLNFRDTEQPLPVEDFGRSVVLVTTHADRAELEAKTVLRPNEGLAVLTAS
jgi:hypothetical protein